MSAALISLLLQLVGALITAGGLGHAAWGVRDLLRILRARREGEHHDVNVAGFTANVFGTATATVKKDWTNVSVTEQLEAIHTELRKLDLDNQQTANRLMVTERRVDGVTRDLHSLEVRSAQTTDAKIDAAIKKLRDDSKISLAMDLAFASMGVILTLVGILAGFWAI